MIIVCVFSRQTILSIKVTPGGPAMTWGMFAIGWLELNQLDKANALFARQFDNVREPFYVIVTIVEIEMI